MSDPADALIASEIDLRLREALALLQKRTPTRFNSLVATKIEEALLWNMGAPAVLSPRPTR